MICNSAPAQQVTIQHATGPAVVARRHSSRSSVIGLWPHPCYPADEMHGFFQWIIAFFVSPAGVAVLAALDSTVLFSLPFGIDAAVILLAAHKGVTAWIVPVVATA